MNCLPKLYLLLIAATVSIYRGEAQHNFKVTLIKYPDEKRIGVVIGKQLFTSFLYPDTLEKPVLYPVFTTTGKEVTRGFPLDSESGDPVDHPHHIGIWFNYENVNGLDFWNNSYAIPQERKKQYGWIKVDSILQATSGKKGILKYKARWTNQQNETQLEELTTLEFSAVDHTNIIDRTTTLTATTNIYFNDVKDGLIGSRLAHALQIPDKKHPEDTIANGNYLSSTGKMGDSVWSTRAAWCKAYGKMQNDSVSIVIIDHPKNPNYPTFWHARGYGLFAANPLGEKAFTNGKSSFNLHLNKGEKVVFRYRIVVDEGKNSISNKEIEKLVKAFTHS